MVESEREQVSLFKIEASTKENTVNSSVQPKSEKQRVVRKNKSKSVQLKAIKIVLSIIFLFILHW